MASLAMLVNWKIWYERNARVSRSNTSNMIMVISKIKEEVTLLSLAGAKALSNVMPRE
jgi:hypothetical protein